MNYENNAVNPLVPSTLLKLSFTVMELLVNDVTSCRTNRHKMKSIKKKTILKSFRTQDTDER